MKLTMYTTTREQCWKQTDYRGGTDCNTTLSPEDRKMIYDSLFSPTADGVRFNFCRMPIGASDYAESWYSHNETDGDYAMEHFSIDRDRKYLLPYIQEAKKRNPDLKLFASPWSPPVWMKTKKAYNYGTLIQTEENLKAYALYFLRFVQAYEKEGLPIAQIHVQNEPMSSQKFPSCIWTGEEFANFIGKYLGPLFEENHVDTKIWLGTLNGPEGGDRLLTTRFNNYANLVLHDPCAAPYVEGVSYQWAGKEGIRPTRQAFPEKKYIQSENECGDGTNTWGYALYIYEMFLHYINSGVCAYLYWNMALPKGGESTWGWTQNSMITIDHGKASFEYEYYIMKHFSRFVERGAERLVLSGHLSSNAAAFRNPDGSTVLTVQNPFDRPLTFADQGEFVTLPPASINTLVTE